MMRFEGVLDQNELVPSVGRVDGERNAMVTPAMEEGAQQEKREQ
jgi:hypothetical protein